MKATQEPRGDMGHTMISPLVSGDSASTVDTGYHSALLCEIEEAPSPATSTPTSSPSSSPASNRSRLDLDLSSIDPSVAVSEKPKNKREATKDTLTGKSVKANTQDTSDLSRGATPKSSVALRTRSRLGDNRRKETSELVNRDLSICSTTVESATSMSSSILNEDSTVATGEVYEKYTHLNDTMDLIDIKVKDNMCSKEDVEEVREYMSEIEVVEVEEDNQDTPARRKNVTFTKEYSRCSNMIDDVLDILQNISGINLVTTPRAHLERIIKILLASMIDQYGLMQDAQASMGNMSELIEELINRGIENEEIRRNEASLKIEKASLEKRIEHLKKHSEQMNQFMMLEENMQMEEINKLLDYKVKNMELQRRLEKVEKDFTEKVDKYEETWRYSQAKKNKVIELEGILKKEKDLRAKLEETLNGEISKQKEKTKEEKGKLAKANKDNKKILTENRILNDQLKDSKKECSDLKDIKKNMEANWRSEKTGYLKKIDDQRKEMININEINNHSAHLLQERIKNLENTLTNRKTQENNMRNDFDATRKELKETKTQLNTITKKAEETKSILDEFMKDKTQTQTSPSVAVFKEPGPYRKGEEDVSVDLGEESTCLQSTGGGILGDTEDTESTPSTTGTIPKSKRIPKIRKRNKSQDNQSVEGMETQSSSRRSSVTSQRETEKKIDLETLNKRLEEQQFQHNLEMKNLREELQRKEVEAPPRKEGPCIETITPENCHRISPNYPGMLINADGSLTKTPMSEAWSRFTTCQLEKRHESTPPKEEFLHPSHPNPTFYDSTWSREGEWIDIPKEPNGTGTEKGKYTTGRIEKIITREGNIKELVGYGKDKETLKIWYSLEEMKKVFPNWVRPNPPKYYNGQVFTNAIRRPQEREKNEAAPIDQSSKDIQGGRGRGRGRGGSGYTRGSSQSQHRGGGRGHYDGNNQWDAPQSSGYGRGGPSQSQPERTWWEGDFSGSSSNTNQERTQNRDNQNISSYTTKGYDDRKRARSPSPRDNRYRRERSPDRYNPRREYHEEYNRNYGASTSSRDYSPGRRDHEHDRPRYRNNSRPRYSRESSPNEGRRYPGHNR